jgi:hypothetical protein
MRASDLAALLRQLAAELSWHPKRGLWIPWGQAWVPPEQARAWLTEHLYQRFFVRWVQPPPGMHRSFDVAGAPAFVDQLSREVGDAAYWEAGWWVAHVSSNGTFVSNGEIRLFVSDPHELRPRRPQVGDQVRVRLPCALPAAVPGFFALVSRRGRFRRDGPHIRVYMNLTPAGAVGMAGALARLETARFEAKFVNDPAGYGRCDTGVIYVEPGSFDALAARVRRLERRHPRWWRAGTPPLTFPVGRGTSVAEAPPELPEGASESYGQHRCRLVATGVLAALAGNAPPGAAWRTCVSEAFAEEGLSLERSYVTRLRAHEARGRIRFQGMSRRGERPAQPSGTVAPAAAVRRTR